MRRDGTFVSRVSLTFLAFAVTMLCLTAAARAAEPGPAGVLWLEAEQFAVRGGWSNDSQFVDLMGSPYLLATGVGTPVKDAVTKVAVARPGDYRLWVRCKDWHPKHSPGRFEVVVGGRASKVKFGRATDDDWRWIDGGTFDLKAGDVEVRLHDLTGWWGRCDAVVLARNEGVRPADGLDALARQREAYGGVSREVKRPEPYDVVVVGGGLAGAAAAVVAARHDARVALIQDRPVLGGNASTEIGVPPEGDKTRDPLDPGETGILEEFEPPGPGRFRDWSSSMEKVVRAQRNLDLYLNTRATGATMKDKKTIRSVEALNVHTGERLSFEAALFIDATGDGWVGFWAGADYRHGRESRDEYGESLAPPEADDHTMGNTLYDMAFRDRDEEVPFEAPPWAYKWDSPDDFQDDPVGATHTDGPRPDNFANLKKSPGRPPKKVTAGYREWWVELGGMYDTIEDAEFIRDELFRINIGMWDYAKNYHPKFKLLNRHRELVWISHIPGKRESRRLLGDYVMTQNDYTEKTIHPDSIAYGGWGIDVHHPWGFFAYGNMYLSAFRQKVSIPYRSLYSRNIDNLMMAGRDASVSHIALGATRVMRTCCLMGQAAGTAAAIAVKRYATPRGVYQKHLDELQDTMLRDGCYLMGRPSRDPSDLARSAAVRASSVAVIPDPRLTGGQAVAGDLLIHDLNTPRAVMFAAEQDRLESVVLYLRSSRGKPTPLRAVLRPAANLGDFSSTKDLAEATAQVPPRKAGWVEFPLKAKLEKGKHYYIALPDAKGLKWDLFVGQPKGTARAYGSPDWKRMYGCYKFRLTPGGEPIKAVASESYLNIARLAPENVVDGWNRAVEGVPNSWGPDPTKPLPQWIELDLHGPTKFNAVHVTFQLASMAASAYRINVSSSLGGTGFQPVKGKPEGGRMKDEGKWKTVVRVNDNTQRRRIHTFAPVTAGRLRLIIEKPSPRSATPRICEIRVYGGE